MSVEVTGDVTAPSSWGTAGATVAAMGRPHRYLAAGAYYHVGAKGNNNEPIFLDDWDRAVFVQILKRVRQRYRWRLHARCLLGNHYHLVVETPLANLSDGMRDLNGQYARAFNERHRRVHHVFGKRFWSRVIVNSRHITSDAEPDPPGLSTRSTIALIESSSRTCWICLTSVSEPTTPPLTGSKLLFPEANNAQFADG